MRYRKAVRVWLWSGVVMIFVQIVLGGVTRLTGSGLSITKWEIITGIVPPLSEKAWEDQFTLYKQTPQYRKINEGMSMGEFKFIYFWEYIHRLWARSIGFVFLIPFVVFASKKWLDKKLYQDLGIAVLLGLVAATFGWVMVASGLENRPWVSGYKLTLHLNIALLLFAWLLWVAIGTKENIKTGLRLRVYVNLFTGLLIAQLLLGGLMSGMKAGLYYPTWPDMHGEIFPKVLIDRDIWTIDRVIHYEKGPMPGVVQFSHRSLAYLIMLIAVLIWQVSVKEENRQIKRIVKLLIFAVIAQVTLGIVTVINCVGKIPLVLGVAHQIMAILLLANVIYLRRKLHT